MSVYFQHIKWRKAEYNVDHKLEAIATNTTRIQEK